LKEYKSEKDAHIHVHNNEGNIVCLNKMLAVEKEY
jgi:hypothetical protein